MTGELQQSADTDQSTHSEEYSFSVKLPPGSPLWCDRSKAQWQRDSLSETGA